ncbi:MAG TPA: DNA circularization N-terminal domain-containing protein, partial [Azonexus sp.]|nr:DNA circularization N-terminal domain-containing protein [Azonexus sp.]
MPFQVEAADVAAGRRNVLHEYPQRDKSWSEDLGRAARLNEVEGFLVGDDYVDQAKKLLDALEQPGPGTLVHPWFGTLTVSLREPGKISFSRSLGHARVVMSFVESGEVAYPAASDSTQAQSRIAAEKIEVASVNNFASRFKVDGFQDFVSAAANGNLSTLTKVIGGGSVPGLDALNYANRAADTLQAAQGMLSSPSALGYKLASFIGITDYLNTGTRWSVLVRSLVRLSGHNDLSPPAAPTIYTPSRQQAYVNATET